jgi:sentrin-specific protease 1
MRTLAVIDVQHSDIRYYDSFVSGRKKANGILRLLSQYVQDELEHYRVDSSCFETNVVSQSPKQTDGSSCGVFTCLTAKRETECILPVTFTQMDIHSFRIKMAADLCGWRQ